MMEKELRSYVFKYILGIILTGIVTISGVVYSSVETTRTLDKRVQLIEKQIELQTNSIQIIRLEMAKKVDHNELTDCLKDLKADMKESFNEIKTDIRELRKTLK